MSSPTSGTSATDGPPLLGPAVPNRGERPPRRKRQRQDVLAPVSANSLRERRERTRAEGATTPPLISREPPQPLPDADAELTAQVEDAGAGDLSWLHLDAGAEPPIAGLEASDSSDRQELPPLGGFESFGPAREEPSDDFGFPGPSPLPPQTTGVQGEEEGASPDPLADGSWLSLIDPEPATADVAPSRIEDGLVDLAASDNDSLSSQDPGASADPGEKWAEPAEHGAGATDEVPQIRAEAPKASGSEARPPAPLLQDVADRLEQIARSLRQRAPAEFFSEEHPSDPLEILITGYAIGYSEAHRQAKERKQREGRDH